MAKYLYMNGSTDHLRTPVVSVDKIVMDFTFELNNPPSTLAYYLFDNRGGTPSGNYMVYINTAGTLLSKGANITSLKLNGTEGGSFAVAPNTRYTIEATGVIVTSDSNGIEFFLNYAAQSTSRTKGKLYRITGYNGSNVIFDYNMSTGTVLDQSGNGNHATLTGGTWLDDGTGGTPTGTDGSLSVDTKQVMYQDGANPFDIRNILYQDGSTSSDTKQVLYQISSTSFDMLQEIFNDGQVGSTPFDMQFALYSDGSILHDSRVVIHDSGEQHFDLQQAIYESGEGKADIHLVLFADSSIHHDLLQSLYENASVQFDTKQISFNPDQQKIGTIRLQGKRDLYVYLVGKQELNVPLKAKRELTVSLKGGVNMTMQNQNFSMSAGDTKYLTFSIEGADDLTGATITWGVRQRSYSSVENILTKSTGNGITVEGSEVKIKLDPEDTELLSGTYHHECELKDNLNNVSTVFTGLMTVNKSAV